jgi:transposase
MNISFSQKHLRFSGPAGILPVSDDDEVCRRLAMLMVGPCEGKGATQAAKQFHFSRQRYYQLLAAFEQEGALGLPLEPRGPKTDYRRTEQIVRLVIRHRFLDAQAAAEVIAQKLRQEGPTISQRSVERMIADYGLQKKLYALNPAHPPQYLQVQRTRGKQRTSPADPASLERQVRQWLADKISGNQAGIWLLLPEHLRLGTWDLLLPWSAQPPQRVEPRLGLHLVNESALCRCSYRYRRTLAQKGFELANRLPLVATDQAMHDLLDSPTVGEAQQLQIALGKLRRAGKHLGGQLLAMDPHRMSSYTQRPMRQHRFSATEKPMKMGQTFFLLDCQNGQPIGFTLASSAQAVAGRRVS